jgi:WD40 repeat protein
LLVSVVAFVAVVWQWQVARRALEIAQTALAETELARQDERQQRIARDEALRQAKVSLYFNRIALAEREWSASQVGGVLSLLEVAPPELRDWEWHYLRRLCYGGLLYLPSKDCTAVSPDDRLIAAGTGKNIKVFDATTGKELLTLGGQHGHSARVNRIAVRSDGEHLASVSDDGTVRVWNSKTGELLDTLDRAKTESETRPALRAVAFDSTGKLLAAGGDDETVTIWDIAHRKSVFELTGHTGNVAAVAYSLDGKVLASASRDRTVRLWDAGKGKLLQTLTGHTAPISAVAFGPASNLVASAGEDHTVRLWDVATGRELRRLEHASPVNDIGFARNGNLASVSGDYLRPGEMRVWDSSTGQLIRTYRWPTQEVTGVAFSANGKRLISADSQSVIVWDATNDLESRSLRGHKEGVMAAAFSPTGSFLASAGEDWMLKIWDLRTEELAHDCAGHTATINALVYSPDGRQLATASDDRTVKIWDTATGMVRHTLTGHTAPVLSLAVSPDGRTLASAASSPDLGGEAKLWDLQTGKEIKTLPVPWVRTLAFSSDGKRLAGGVDRPFRVVVWDGATGGAVQEWGDFVQPVSALAFSGDGRWLAASGGSKREGIIKLWNPATREEVEPIRTRTGRIGSIAFSPDSKRLIAASWDNTLMLFDPITRQDVLTLRGHTDGVTAVAFSADGCLIASASSDKTVRLWNGTPLSGK